MNLFSANTSEDVRRAAVAGQFYPRQPAELRNLVSELLTGAPRASGPAPKALIAPHAGYRFSGPIAASAYAALAADREVIKRVVLLGPSHFVLVGGIAASSARAFATPLGRVPVDGAAVSELVAQRLVTLLDEAHAYEHCLEVQLPFLQVILGEFTIVPLVAGEANAHEIGAVLEALWDGPATRFVISSDLSHYLNSRAAQSLDRQTADAIEALGVERIGEDQACGRVAIRGLLEAAARHGLRARTLDLRNSGDTGGPSDRVVGYGAFAFA